MLAKLLGIKLIVGGGRPVKYHLQVYQERRKIEKFILYGNLEIRYLLLFIHSKQIKYIL